MESESLDFTGRKIPRDYKRKMEERIKFKNTNQKFLKGEQIVKKKSLLVSMLFIVFVIGICYNYSVKAVDAQSEKKETNTESEEGAIQAATLEELSELVSQEMDARVAALNEQYEKLQAEIDTYDKYIENQEKIEDYYSSVYHDMQDTCIRMREYCVKYVQVILESEKENDEKYDDLEEMYDVIYEDAGEDIYDEFYDGVLEDIYDVYYDGILDDAYDAVAYKEWSEARSEEYERWSDARSAAYECWSDFRSEVYEFWSDMRSEFWDDDIDRAQEKIQDFQDDILQLKEENGNAEKSSDQLENTSKTSEGQAASETNTEEIGTDFKEAMDSYEAFYDKYCEFMKKYNANPTDIELISAYGDIMTEMVEMSEKFESWKEGDLNAEELKYYLEVNSRVTQKLAELSE